MSVFLSSKFPGEMRKSGSYSYFLPGDIFSSNELHFDDRMTKKLEEAAVSFGRFVARIDEIPDVDMFVTSYVNKEATHSTRIEGTEADIDDAFEVREAFVPNLESADWHELHQYIQAFKQSHNALKKIPLCERVIREGHKTLMKQQRGHNKAPGEYRKTQNWIGGRDIANARFVPPSPEYVDTAMQNLEAFIQDQDDRCQLSEFIKIALIHWQFETIHPFLDGNGRMGRILIPLYLLEKKMMPKPVLYMSAFFEKHRSEYFDLLNKARESKQELIEWIHFFLEGIAVESRSGSDKTQKLVDLRDDIRQKAPQLGGGLSVDAIKLVEFLFQNPIVDSALVKEKLNLKETTTHRLLNNLAKFGILHETTGRKRNRRFVFKDYLDILNKDEKSAK